MLRYRMLLLLVTTSVMLAAGEIVLRTFRPQPTFSRLDEMSPRFFRYSAVGIFDLLPEANTRHVGPRDRSGHPEYDVHVAIDRSGLRMDREVSEGKGERTWRVSVIGDSFVFGFGVESDEAFPALLERQLRLQVPNIEVLNRGFSMGPSPDTYYANLCPGDRFASDLAIVCLFVGNDIMTPAYDRWLEVDKRGLPTQVRLDYVRVDDLHRFRQAETWWLYRVPVLRESHIAVALASFVKAGATDKTTSMKLDPPEMYGDDWSTDLEASFDKTVRSVVGIRDLCRDRGCQVLVVLIPSQHQLRLVSRLVGWDGQRRPVRQLRKEPGAQNPQRRLRSSLLSNGIEAFDLLPALVAAPEPKLYFEIDGHFTVEGNMVVALALEQEILRRGLVPQPK